PEALERYKRAAEAYDTLSDPDERKEYDNFRKMVRSGGFGRSGGAGFPGGFRSTQEDFDLSDIFGGRASGQGDSGGFGDIFGGVFNRRRGGRTSRRKSE